MSPCWVSGPGEVDGQRETLPTGLTVQSQQTNTTATFNNQPKAGVTMPSLVSREWAGLNEEHKGNCFLRGNLVPSASSGLTQEVCFSPCLLWLFNNQLTNQSISPFIAVPRAWSACPGALWPKWSLREMQTGDPIQTPLRGANETS